MILRNILTTPSKIASSLDWKKATGSCILSLDIHRDRIGMVVASHPSYGDEVSTFDPLPLCNKRGEVDRTILETLDSVIKEHKVCGVVVSWPLQKETGKMGAECGHVLHTLENLLERQEQIMTDDETDDNSSSSSLSSSVGAPVLSQKTPLCLWNPSHVATEQTDEWGRCASYGYTEHTAAAVAARSNDDTSVLPIHVASKEQYYQNENMVAIDVWDDFCRTHWPALYEQQYAATTILDDQQEPLVSSSSTTVVVKEELDEVEWNEEYSADDDDRIQVYA